MNNATIDIKTASIKELKQFTAENNISITGDKRRKSSYILAVTEYFSSLTPVYNEESNSVELTTEEQAVVEDVAPVEQPIYFTQDEVFTVVKPAIVQTVDEVITTSKIEDIEVVDDLWVDTEAHAQLSNQDSPASVPMLLVLWTIAIVLVPGIILFGFSISTIRKILPLLDKALSATLLGLERIAEFIIGDEYDEYPEEMSEIRHLI